MPRRGFTLIELLVVVAVIAILAAIAVPNFLEAQTRSKISRAKADLATIATAMESYRVDNNGYPPDWDSGLYGVTGLHGEWKTYAQLTTPVAYLTTAPRDPFNSQALAGDGSAKEGVEDVYYEYYCLDAILKFGDAWAPTWQARGIHWFAYSFGPDRKNDQLAKDQTLAVSRSYDPTNGTVSAGDFGRSNIGCAPAQ